MQIYSKSMKNATSLSFLGRFWFCLIYLIGLGGGFKISTQNLKFINYANLCIFIQKQQKMLLLYKFHSGFWELFVLSDRAWWGLRNCYTELWNSLIMQIYSKSMKNAASPLFRNHNRSALEAGTYITHRVIYYSLVEIWFIKSASQWTWQMSS